MIGEKSLCPLGSAYCKLDTPGIGTFSLYNLTFAEEFSVHFSATYDIYNSAILFLSRVVSITTGLSDATQNEIEGCFTHLHMTSRM